MVEYLHYITSMHAINVHPHEVFQAVSDATRIRILRLFAVTNEEACLCELVDSLLEAESNVSRHLKILRQAGLLTSSKEGRWVYHRLVDEVPYLTYLYDMLRALPDKDKVFGADLKEFRKRMGLREKGRCRVGVQTRELAMVQLRARQ